MRLEAMNTAAVLMIPLSTLAVVAMSAGVGFLLGLLVSKVAR